MTRYILFILLFSCLVGGIFFSASWHFASKGKDLGVGETAQVDEATWSTDFSSELDAIMYFESIAAGFSSHQEMMSWLIENGFVVEVYRGLEAGSLDDKDAIRLLATFSIHPEKMTPQYSFFGKFYSWIKQHFEQWSFLEKSSGITVLYNDESSFSEVKINPIRGL